METAIGILIQAGLLIATVILIRRQARHQGYLTLSTDADISRRANKDTIGVVVSNPTSANSQIRRLALCAFLPGGRVWIERHQLAGETVPAGHCQPTMWKRHDVMNMIVEHGAPLLAKAAPTSPLDVPIYCLLTEGSGKHHVIGVSVWKVSIEDVDPNADTNADTAAA